METKKELIIAGVVGLIMLAICAFIVFGPKVDKDASDVKFYKLVAKEGIDLESEDIEEQDKYVYVECNGPNADKLAVKKDMKKILNFKMESSQPQQIKGNYKVVLGEDFIAFDDSSSNLVYASSTNRTYPYYSESYSKVVKACE